MRGADERHERVAGDATGHLVDHRSPHEAVSFAGSGNHGPYRRYDDNRITAGPDDGRVPSLRLPRSYRGVGGDGRRRRARAHRGDDVVRVAAEPLARRAPHSA
jgi:hypothetical protein